MRADYLRVWRDAQAALPEEKRIVMTYDQREDIIFDLQRVRITDWANSPDGHPEEIREVTASDMLDCVLGKLGLNVHYVSPNAALNETKEKT